VHAEVARPVAVEYSPAAQLVHAEVARPKNVEYRPAAQLTHPVDHVLDWYLPAAHLRQSLSTIEPVPTRNVPATHATHAVVPVLGW
jgi:hypothetical protein